MNLSLINGWLRHVRFVLRQTDNVKLGNYSHSPYRSHFLIFNGSLNDLLILSPYYYSIFHTILYWNREYQI